MARRRNPPESIRAKWMLADRLRTIRGELLGEGGLTEFAHRLDVPVRTWYSYESGVTVPAEVLLRFIELTRVEPLWLLHGRGPKYHQEICCDEALAPPSPAVAFREDRPWQVGPDGLLDRLAVPSVPFVAHDPGQELPTNASAARHDEGRSTATRSATIGPWPIAAGDERPLDQGGCRFVRVEGDAMAPIVADGAFIGFDEAREDPESLEGKLVVVQVDGRPMVREFHWGGRYALLRARNPTFEPATQLLDLSGGPDPGQIRRVLWVGTPH